MSTRIMGLCWPLQMPPTAKAVLISLADNANDHGECYPSIAYICERTCYKKDAVIEAIAWMEKAGALVADRENGRHTKYRLTPKNYAEIPYESRRKTTRANRLAVTAKPVGQTDALECANQSGKPTSRANPPVGQPELNQSGKPTKPVGQPDTNRQEPSLNQDQENITHSRSKPASKLDYSVWPSQPSPQTLTDWLSHRRQKRASVTQTVINRLAKEFHLAAQAGFSVDDCLTESMTRGWQGFEFSWMQRGLPHANHQRPDQRPDTSAAGRVRANIAAARAARGEGGGVSVANHDVDVRPQVGQQLRGGGGS